LFLQRLHVQLAAYEGGEGFHQDNTSVEVAAIADPRMKTLTINYFNLWLQKAGTASLFNYYNLYSAYGTFGGWGAKPNQADPCSQKWPALMQLTNGSACTP
jgi:hypothetical protein